MENANEPLVVVFCVFTVKKVYFEIIILIQL